MNWSQYGKTFSKNFNNTYNNSKKSYSYSTFSKNLYKNKYLNNFINSNNHLNKFSVMFLNTMNFQANNFLNNFTFDSMQISSKGFSMLEAEKTQEDITALQSRIQNLMNISSITYLNEIIVGLKGKIKLYNI